MLEIKLHGKLSDLHSGTIKIDEKTPRGAFRFLTYVLDGFKQAIAQGDYTFSLDSEGKQLIDETDYELPLSSNETLHILPSLKGMKAGSTPVIAPDASAYESRESDIVSSMFNSTINTITQGQIIPVVYGEVIAGSHVIAAGISSEYKSFTNPSNNSDTYTSPNWQGKFTVEP